MKVSELIGKLNKLKPDEEIGIAFCDDDGYFTIIDVERMYGDEEYYPTYLGTYITMIEAIECEKC